MIYTISAFSWLIYYVGDRDFFHDVLKDVRYITTLPMRDNFMDHRKCGLTMQGQMYYC